MSVSVCVCMHAHKYTHICSYASAFTNMQEPLSGNPINGCAVHAVACTTVVHWFVFPPVTRKIRVQYHGSAKRTPDRTVCGAPLTLDSGRGSSTDAAAPTGSRRHIPNTGGHAYKDRTTSSPGKLEPPTLRLATSCSNHLGRGRHVVCPIHAVTRDSLYITRCVPLVS